MIGAVMASLPPEAFATMMPVIFYAMDKAGGYGELTSAIFFNTLPPPVQDAYASWKAAFEVEFLGVLETLRAKSVLIDGFRTPRVDTSDLAYQADANFMPDKEHLWKAPAEHDGWVHAHNAVRFEIGEMKRVLAALSSDGGSSTKLVQWQLDAVQAWWAGHERHVHEHHSNEDDIMNPVLRTRINYPEKLEADHAALVAAMDAVGAAVNALTVGGTLDAIVPLWAAYEAIMLPHLFEEEQVGLPLTRAYFTPQEIDAVTQQFLKKGDPVALGSFVHTMGHKKDAKLFMRENGIPPFVWHIPGKGFKSLRTLYRAKMQAHIDSLLAGERVGAKTKKQAKENAAKAATKHSATVAEQCLLSPSKRVNVMSPRF